MAERVLEHFIDDQVVPWPELRLLPGLQAEPATKARFVERQTGVERSSLGDILINVVVEVDEQPYEMCINISRRTLGNGLPISTFFERFERRRQNADGTISGDLGRADTLAEHALYIAER